MRGLQLLEKQKTWKREAGFDRIEIIADMREQHLLADFHSESLYTKLDNPRWSYSPEEHKLEMEVDVERLRMEIVLSQPAPPPQYESSPRRLPRSIWGQINSEYRKLGVGPQRGNCFFSASQRGCFSVR